MPRDVCVYCSGKGYVTFEAFTCPMCYGNLKSSSIINSSVSELQKMINIKLDKKRIIDAFLAEGRSYKEDSRLIQNMSSKSSTVKIIFTYHFLEALFILNNKLNDRKNVYGKESAEVRRYQNKFYNLRSFWASKLDSSIVQLYLRYAESKKLTSTIK